MLETMSEAKLIMGMNLPWILIKSEREGKFVKYEVEEQTKLLGPFDADYFHIPHTQNSLAI
jgi:hypothetical protein